MNGLLYVGGTWTNSLFTLGHFIPKIELVEIARGGYEGRVIDLDLDPVLGIVAICKFIDGRKDLKPNRDLKKVPPSLS